MVLAMTSTAVGVKKYRLFSASTCSVSPSP
ncbi:MAG: hypothetical protein H6Q82_2493, partial [Deltaproteobacteria bacterium]|nr:hypothetical protein [Deltaproteobacteria bacterium]